MVYVGLDLDNTLGDFTSLFPFFDKKLTLFGYPPSDWYKQTSNALVNIDKKNNPQTYNKIVKILAEKENSLDSFGLFNPDMMEILSDMKKAKDNGLIEAIVIYSNNSNPEVIQFVADIIGSILGDKYFIDKIAHRLYRKRIKTDKKSEFLYIKTIEFLKILFQEVVGKKPIQNNEIIFYDDQIHPDLRNALKEKYIHVKPGYFSGPETLEEYFEETIEINNYIKEKLREFKTPRTKTPRTFKTSRRLTRKKQTPRKFTIPIIS